MIVRGLEALKALGQYAEKPGAWTSSRYLLARDDCGFTLTRTTLAAGSRLEMEYKNHVEANLIIEGQARVTDVATGEVHALAAGDMYTLDNHDRHILEADTDLVIVCVFLPALVGPETHDADGSYPILAQEE
ncbi:MAG: ectoine synthase [Pseudomonadota bacterium]